jgi:homocysteine S-methyltransferase
MMLPQIPKFEDALSAGPLVFDGATGTMLYERGVYLNKCFDELCLSNPDLVAEVHRAYADVGVDVIQTNTYGTNRLALAAHGLEGKVEAICQAAVKIARSAARDNVYVAGSVGPTGLLPKDLIRQVTRRQAFEAYREAATALAEAGADLLVFETFGYLAELEIALEATYGLSIPVVAQAAFGADLLTHDGATPHEATERLKAFGPALIGANCVLGPERILDVAEGMVGQGVKIVLQPNAGFPRTVDGRALYQTSPETFGVCARRAFKMGVSAFGGCCGTNPEYMRRVVGAARMMGGGKRAAALEAQPRSPRPGNDPMPEVPLGERSVLGKSLADGEFVVSVELLPPPGLSPEKCLDKVRKLEAGGVRHINIPDGPRAMVRMANLPFARLVAEETRIEPILHVCGRDRNLLALQGDLLGAHALGIRNTVIITGDPPKVGDYPDATAVFDLDSIGLLHMAQGLNGGLDPAGKHVGDQTRFVLLTGAEPAALDFEREIARLAEKKEAGAQAVMTQPVYDPEVLDRFLPLATLKNAKFLHDNVPGMRVPDSVITRLKEAGDDPKKQQEAGITIAVETLVATRGRVRGVYLMPPFGRVGVALDVLQQSEIL